MRVSYGPCHLKKCKDFAPGQTFIWEGGVYLVSNSYDGTYLSCINLESGAFKSLPKATLVEKVEGVFHVTRNTDTLDE
jgi:hypothetical protein